VRTLAIVIASLLAAGPAIAQTPPAPSAAPTAPAPSGAAMCGPDQLPSGVDLEGQIRAQNPGFMQVAVTPVANFAGLWKALTDKFGQPPPSVVKDPSMIKSLQVVWFVDPSTPFPTASADIYAFDAMNCYVVDIGIEAPLFDLITPFTPLPPFAPKLPGGSAAPGAGPGPLPGPGPGPGPLPGPGAKANP
jgi:hypothetical protein